MTENQAQRHTLQGFPDAALRLQRALDLNRQRIALSKGLSGIELRAFFRIAQSGSITPKTLAQQLSVTTGAITGIATRLVDAELIIRAAHPNDRRSIYLELAEHGHGVMRDITADFTEMVAAATSAVSPEDLEITTRAMESIALHVFEALGESPD